MRKKHASRYSRPYWTTKAGWYWSVRTAPAPRWSDCVRRVWAIEPGAISMPSLGVHVGTRHEGALRGACRIWFRASQTDIARGRTAQYTRGRDRARGGGWCCLCHGGPHDIFRAVRHDFEGAARIDGAYSVQVLWHIVPCLCGTTTSGPLILIQNLTIAMVPPWSPSASCSGVLRRD